MWGPEVFLLKSTLRSFLVAKGKGAVQPRVLLLQEAPQSRPLAERGGPGHTWAGSRAQRTEALLGRVLVAVGSGEAEPSLR